MIYDVYGNVDYFLFDEIQNVEGWHLFVNHLLRNGKHVVITGSNARLLTGDLATHLTGRHIPISALYNSIVSKDILGRRKVRNAQRFVNAAYVLMQQFAREVMKNSDGDLRILFILSS